LNYFCILLKIAVCSFLQLVSKENQPKLKAEHLFTDQILTANALLRMAVPFNHAMLLKQNPDFPLAHNALLRMALFEVSFIHPVLKTVIKPNLVIMLMLLKKIRTAPGLPV